MRPLTVREKTIAILAVLLVLVTLVGIANKLFWANKKSAAPSPVAESISAPTNPQYPPFEATAPPPVTPPPPDNQLPPTATAPPFTATAPPPATTAPADTTTNAVTAEDLARLAAENANISNQVKRLEGQKASLADQVKKLNADLIAQAKTAQANYAKLTNELASLEARLASAAATANTAINTNAATATASGVAKKNIIVAVVSTATNSVIFYQDGSINTTHVTITNAPKIGMIDGLPVLIDNISEKTLTLTLERLTGQGSITLPVIAKQSDVTIFLLPGQYGCTWRIRGTTKVAGTCTMTISKDDPADLVVGKGIYANTLTLVDK